MSKDDIKVGKKLLKNKASISSDIMISMIKNVTNIIVTNEPF